VKVEGAVEVVLDELTSRSDCGELVNANTHGLSFDALTAARKFVEFLPVNFLGRIHRRYLVDVTTKTL